MNVLGPIEKSLKLLNIKLSRKVSVLGTLVHFFIGFIHIGKATAFEMFQHWKFWNNMKVHEKCI